MSLRPAATIVLMRAGLSGMELLLLKRGSEAAHFGGDFVFPGGLLDSGDLSPQALSRVVGLSEAEANRRLRVASGGLGYYIAAVRECFEESGMLLALEADGARISPDRLAQLALQRQALNAGQLSFPELLDKERLFVPANEIAYFAHWITPPLRERRFDTRFFVAVAPEGQEVLHDGMEMSESRWMGPREALECVERGQMQMAFATRQITTGLAKFHSPPQVMAHAQSVTEVVVNRPCLAQGRDGQKKMFRLGDAAYDEIHWVDPEERGTSTYDLEPGVPKRLDRYVTRILAPNRSVMTGPGTNTYLVGEREVAVIDPGPTEPSHIAAILAAGAGRIRWIVCTHTHPDHSPAATELRRVTGATVVGRRSATSLEGPGFFDRELADGESVQFDGVLLRAIHTPGHASNHMCYLLDNTGMLFSGDHIIQGSTVVIAPPDGNLRAYLQSLQKLLSIELAIIAPGHGYLIGRPHAEVTRIIQHRLGREEKVRRAMREAGAPATAQALLPRVYDDVPAALHPLASRSLQAHLEKLVEDGELVQDQNCFTFVS